MREQTNHNFGVGVEVDNQTGELIAVYFKIRNGKSAETKELQGGAIFVDYNSRGELLGVEMLAPCEIEVLDKITEDDPETQKFVRRSAPREMVIA